MQIQRKISWSQTQFSFLVLPSRLFLHNVCNVRHANESAFFFFLPLRDTTRLLAISLLWTLFIGGIVFSGCAEFFVWKFRGEMYNGWKF